MAAMSENPTLVTAEHFRYVASHTVQEDDLLKSLKKAAAEAGMPPIAISAAQASFMQILLKATKARNVVEVGTLGGYSAIWMARALPGDGKVKTLEISPKHAEFARGWVAKSDVAGKVEVLLGDGRQVLPTLATDWADAAFLDADKVSYPAYLEQCLRIVKKGGLIMVDNAFAFGQLFDQKPTDREAPAIQAFNEIVPKTRGLHGVIVPLGDGCWVCVKE
jgi:predicted O-methyltransferase YrrM